MKAISLYDPMPLTPKRVTAIIPPRRRVSSSVSVYTGKKNSSHPLIDYSKKNVGRYELIYHIASGGMASVYAARLVGMAGFERLVAVKIIHPHLTSESSFIEMFLDEARLVARINHPGVATIYEVGTDDGLYYMAGELVQGKDLKQILEKAYKLNRTLPLRPLLEALSTICSGLADAHALTNEQGLPLNLIHRDVSTRNILISYTGHPKLIDFGAAFANDRLTHTSNGLIKGKVGYMPPEQLRGDPLDHRADIYSLGIVLYIVATGYHPFPYENPGQQIYFVLKGKYSPPRELNPALDKVLENIILRAMSFDAGDRFSSMDELKSALDSYCTTRLNEPSEGLVEIMKDLFAYEMREERARIESHRHRQQQQARHPGPKKSQTEAHPVVPGDDSFRRAFLPVSLALTVLLTGAIALFLMSKNPHTANGASDTAVTLVNEKKSGHSSLTAPAETEPIRVPAVSPQNRKSTTPAEPENATIRVEHPFPSSTFWIADRQVPYPITLPRSRSEIAIEVRTPGYETATIHVVPGGDVILPLKLSKKQAPNKANRKNTKRLRSSPAPARNTETTDSANDGYGKNDLGADQNNNSLSLEKKNSLSFEKNPFQPASRTLDSDYTP